MSFPYPYSGPIAPENNPPIEPQFYQPSRFEITDITLGQTTTIETAEDHNYVIGQLIRVLIPSANGTSQISGEQGYVLSIPAADEVVVSINSSQANSFIASDPDAFVLPQIIALGDVNSGVQSTSGRTNVGTYIPGSFINISPN